MANPVSSTQSDLKAYRLKVWEMLTNNRERERASVTFENYYSKIEGRKEENRNKTKAPSLYSPFDRTRVVVQKDRYLSANWVRELHGGQWWIATHAPFANTLHTFFSLFLQDDARPPPGLEERDSIGSKPCRIRTIVQLTTTGYAPYLPDTENGEKIVRDPENGDEDDLKITLVKKDDRPSEGFVESDVRLVRCSREDCKVEKGEYVFLKYFIFTLWGDHSVPEEGRNRKLLLDFARRVAKANHKSQGESTSSCHPNPPMLVHCSQGVGRTGTWICINDNSRSKGFLPYKPKVVPALPEAKIGPLPPEYANDPIACGADSVKEQRCGMIDEDVQLLLVYELHDTVAEAEKKKAEAEEANTKPQPKPKETSRRPRKGG